MNISANQYQIVPIFNQKGLFRANEYPEILTNTDFGVKTVLKSFPPEKRMSLSCPVSDRAAR